MFLTDPWLWPEIWYVNPQVENPHLIYPGDVLSLVYVDGQPRVKVERGYRTVKLSPRVREESLDRAIPTIPLDAIRQFLGRPLVVDENELKEAAYVVSSAGEHLITGAGDRVYVRGIAENAQKNQSLFRPGGAYIDPVTGEILGYEALYLGEGTVTRSGDPATISLKATTREINTGDRALPTSEEDTYPSFAPHAAAGDTDGFIISVMDGVSQIGQYQVVVINRGTREGVDVGTVMAVNRTGDVVPDRVSAERNDMVKLPDERSGVLLVFRVFEKVSYGLIMKATDAIHVGDKLAAP
jgi:nucleoid-associated protein YgaU